VVFPEARKPSAFDRYMEPAAIAELLEDPRADGVPRDLRDPEAMSRTVKVWSQMRTERVCMIHGDSHYGNVFYDRDGRSGHYDWQNYHCAHWCHDVSYFIGTALRVRDRERSEQDLIRHYVDQLRACGVDELNFDDAWLTYRQFLIYGLWIFLANWSEMQPFEVNATYVTRFAAAVGDHDTYGLLAKAGIRKSS
jgi:aminoglycoside phosphotransferase (APT) family kinase protein